MPTMRELQERAKDQEYWAKQLSKNIRAPGNDKDTDDYLRDSANDLDSKARKTRDQIRQKRDEVESANPNFYGR